MRKRIRKRTRASSHARLALSLLLAVWIITLGCSGDGAGVGGDDSQGKSAGQVAGDTGKRGTGDVSASGAGVAGDEPGEPGADEPEAPSLVYTRTYYSYRVARSQDPFQPLLREGEKMDGLSLHTLILTGILWDDEQSMVVLEDSRGMGYSLRVGDRLAGAKLVAIREDAAVFRVVEFGEVHSVVKELFVKEKPI